MNIDLEFERTIHARLLSRDATASEELAQQYLPAVHRHVHVCARRRGVQDEALINDAATESVLNYIRHPSKFDSTKSSLLGYLKRAAERDLINFLAKDRRQRRGEQLTDNVEFTMLHGNKPIEMGKIRRDAETEMLLRLDAHQSTSNRLADVMQTAQDKNLLELMLSGERTTAAFASVLGIVELPQSEQRKIVKKHKDRLKKQLQRSGGKQRG